MGIISPGQKRKLRLKRGEGSAGSHSNDVGDLGCRPGLSGFIFSVLAPPSQSHAKTTSIMVTVTGGRPRCLGHPRYREPHVSVSCDLPLPVWQCVCVSLCACVCACMPGSWQRARQGSHCVCAQPRDQSSRQAVPSAPRPALPGLSRDCSFLGTSHIWNGRSLRKGRGFSHTGSLPPRSAPLGL